MITDTQADLRLAASRWHGLYTASQSIRLTRATLPSERSILLMGERGSALGPALGFALAPW